MPDLLNELNCNIEKLALESISLEPGDILVMGNMMHCIDAL